MQSWYHDRKEINTITVDAGYKTPWIFKKVQDDGQNSVQASYELSRLRNWVRLKFAVMNLKKLAMCVGDALFYCNSRFIC
jgi:hypothetical protein